MTQFGRFIGGTNWDDLPELFSVVARFKFIPVTERRAEAPHGLVHRRTGFRNVLLNIAALLFEDLSGRSRSRPRQKS
jgi:hypothetical protein